MTNSSTHAKLGFASPDTVIPDHEREGLLRAPEIDQSVYDVRDQDQAILQQLAYYDVPLYDWTAANAEPLSLHEMGFDAIDLGHVKGLNEVLDDVRRNNELSDLHIKQIRRKLWGRGFKLSNGKTLRILFIAGDGLIMRKGGPNGLNLTPDAVPGKHNDHYSAPIIHGDQDVFGTPIKQYIKGFGPRLFRHQTPDGENKKSRLFLCNIWMPLQQILQPLTLLDRRSLDAKKQQLRYALKVDEFLDRNELAMYNDIWMFLYHPDQRWYFSPDLQVGKAYVFDTLGEAHGSCNLVGEDVAEQYYRCLQQLVSAVSEGDEAKIKSLASLEKLTYPNDITQPLAQACDLMYAMIAQARDNALDQLRAGSFEEQAATVLDSVVRKSIELRAVCWVS